MFCSFRKGDDDYSDFVKRENEKIEKEVKSRMEKLNEINSKLDTALKLLDRVGSDINRMEREIKVLKEESNDKLIKICEITEDISDILKR